MAIERILYVYKGDCCACCDKTLTELARRFGTAKGQFDMNHSVPAKKAADYENLIRQKTLSSRQLDEVDKCVLLCKECHTALHGQNIRMEVDVELKFDGIVISHSLQCQVIRDFEKGEDQLFHDSLPYLHLLRVKVGGYHQLHSCLQLRENEMLEKLIHQTKGGDELTIETLNGFPLFRATRQDEDQFEFSQSAHFLGSAIQLRSLLLDGPMIDLFVRNSRMLVMGHIGYGIDGTMRATCRSRYGSSQPVEYFDLVSPDPLAIPGRAIDFGPSAVVKKAIVLNPR